MTRALRVVLQSRVLSRDDARRVWSAVPAVLNRCNELETYSLPGAAPAYAWLHLPDRYVRTWLSLQALVEQSLLPMGREGVRTLDVGTGPGPSAFAIHDFYAATVKFADTTGKRHWRQPPEVKCVESSGSMNGLRHQLAETLHTQGAPTSVLDMCSYMTDFKSINPSLERRQLNKTLRNAYDDYHDPDTGQCESERLHTPQEANHAANTLHRYRLFAFTNFLTTPLTVDCFRENLTEILNDANPGSVLLTVGGTGGSYPDINEEVRALAAASGFARSAEPEEVSCPQTMANIVYANGACFYRHLSSTAGELPEDDYHARRVKAHFEGQNRVLRRISTIRAYRKQRWGSG